MTETTISNNGLARFWNSLPERPRQIGAIIIAGALLVVFPFIVRNIEQQFTLSLLFSFNVALLYVVLSLGLNIVVGFAGLLDLGYAAFFAIGAYAFGILTWPVHGLEWSFWIAMYREGAPSWLRVSPVCMIATATCNPRAISPQSLAQILCVVTSTISTTIFACLALWLRGRQSLSLRASPLIGPC